MIDQRLALGACTLPHPRSPYLPPPPPPRGLQPTVNGGVVGIQTQRVGPPVSSSHR